ncbi:ribosome recycling factor [Lacihabitans sp. CS3-21]|jgi:ribosome recycling factor|uniref:ribosome recycling factor n=1 Tax=Lacihabitans sp. CS3-21 TaxID=2487332 RepID=UPI000BC44E83|nr:ribosome recycling factor [Lacihabitans sp. CS3-21]MCP9747954.1 ribosome recycling factor [Lacihabitans sp. CS3-21]MDP1817100.1 ribosome recycling factor [Leadbetterella sp.]OYU64689.1 MAG: ribosome recycling factor [Cytophagaceae bacterium BCCC1]
MEEIDLLLDMAQDSMERAMKHTQIELSKIRAGKASTNMLDGIQVEYYGIMTPIAQVSSITTPDARTIQLKPFERKTIGDIERAIINSNVGLNPANDGETIRLNVPPLTEERRRDLVKKVKQEIEVAKVNIRKVRQETNDDLKKLKNDGVSEDAIKMGEEKVQKLTNQFIDKTDQMFAAKETDIMQV